jgi:hypothetical protein
MVTEYGLSERLGARKFGSGDSEPFLGREMSHSRDYSEGIASAIDDEVRRLIEAAHDEAWDVLVQYRDVLDNLVLQLMEHETLARTQVLEIFASVQKRPSRGSYTGYGKRMPSDRPPVLTQGLAPTAAWRWRNRRSATASAEPVRAGTGRHAASMPDRSACRAVRHRRCGAGDGGPRHRAVSQQFVGQPVDLPRIERAVREILLAIARRTGRNQGAGGSPTYAEKFAGLSQHRRTCSPFERVLVAISTCSRPASIT